ncbi:hypothetical protein H6F43_13500, partial [Leptolyngbya sp. FACHB-36]|nr:hypothetical protein [Leptolyngbya sp. FACHB-36]
MNLPFILDVGIGLVFIFLTLSLLASEIQELLATLLQWRAKHLKQAIETLLAGENKIEPTPDAPDDQPVQVQISQSKELANSLYSHPLIRSLNQEAKGILGQVGQAVSQLTQTARVFSGRSSGPSYLPSDAFATTLLETLRAEDLMHKLSEVKLNRLLQTKLIDPIREIILDLRNSTANDSLLDPEFQLLESELSGISQTFTRREITLASSFDQTVAALQRLITASEATLPQDDSVSQTFLKRLSTIAEEMPSLQNESKPSIVETMSELSTMSWVAQQLRQHRDYRIAFTRLQD